jgi:F-type H+-transporting ATPase subunit delta
MAKRVSGRRFAQALFELAVEQDQLEQWGGDLRFADQVLQDEEFKAFLSHAEVPLARKTGALEAVLEQVNPLVRNLVSLLVSRGIVDLIHDVQVAYQLLLDQHMGRQQVEITSAVPLNDQELEQITRFVTELTKKEVAVSTQVDELILGGVVIQIGDQLLDGSTRSRLEEMRKQIRSEGMATAPGP